MPGIGNYDVQYTLILKDQMSKTLAKAEAATRGFNSYVTAGQNQMAAMFTKGNIAMGAMAAGAWVAGRSIKAAMDFENTTVQMEVLMGSVEKAKKLIEETEAFAIKSPYGSKDLIDSEKLLLNFGVAHKKIMPTMKMLGDIAMGDAEKLHRMSLAYGQMSSAGRLMGQDLLQMINAGFNPLQEISKRTGISMGELRKEMERGNISVQMVEQAFIDATAEGGRFSGMMDRQSKTMSGQWSASVEKFDITTRNLANKGLPALNKGLEGTNKLLEGNGEGFGNISESTVRANPLTAWYEDWLKGIADKRSAAKMKNNFFDLHTTMQMIATISAPRLSMELDKQSQLIETAANLTDTQLTASLDRAQKMYGITSAQIDVFMGKVRQQKKLMGEDAMPKQKTLDDYEQIQRDLQERQKKESGDRKTFNKYQKEIDKNQKEIDKITGKQSLGSRGGGGGAGGEGSTISSRAPQYFTITIDQLVGTINTKKEVFNESDNETMKKVTEALVTSLNDTQLIAANK